MDIMCIDRIIETNIYYLDEGNHHLKNRIITVQDVQITVSFDEQNDYICISDMAKAKGGESRAADVIKYWLRNRITLESLGTWEQIYNPDFKVVEFDHLPNEYPE